MEKTNFQKMAIFHILLLILLIPSIVVPAFASVDDFTTDKFLYHQGDQLAISGTVSYDSDIPFVTIQIFTPGKSSFADFNTIPANPNGSFSATFNVGGPTWPSDGIYSIKVTYDGNLEKSIEYQEFSESTQPEPTSEPTQPEPTPESQANTSENQEPVPAFNTLKLTIPNFPALDKSPQYYIDRYNDESSYKSWFDSQFTNSSIYNILGYEDPVSLPEWIRDYAEWWAIGDVDDSQFVAGLEFMLENNIIMVSGVSSSGNSSTEEIPDWVRNNAHWWSQDLISEDDFINSLEYLIREGIIIIN